MARGQDDLGCWREPLQALADGEPIIAGQMHVQQHDIRPERERAIEGAASIGRLADHAKPAAFEHLADDEAERPIVVHDEDAAHRSIVARRETGSSGPTLDWESGSRAYAVVALRE